MRVRSFSDARAFNEHIGPALVPWERENNLLLGIVKGLTERPNDRAVMLAVEDADRPVCAAVMTPPFNLILSTGPAEAVPILAGQLRGGDIALPGVISIAKMADAFAAAWRRPDAGRIGKGIDMRLYSLGTPPPPGTTLGELRPAAAADIPLLRDWAVAFFADAGLPPFEGEAFVARLEEMIAVARLWLWDNGRPVCMVGHTETTPRTARIGPVYTPPGLRGRGYATAAVGALTRRLLAGGRAWCLLFADVANPTATNMYRRIGYEEVCLFREYRFGR
jgi:GNAT superfamily N-acetyltransferase